MDIFIQAEDEDVPLVRGDLVASQDEEAMSLPQVFDRPGIPYMVMVRKTDAVQADQPGLLDEPIGRC